MPGEDFGRADRAPDWRPQAAALAAFAAGILACIGAGASLLWALAFGWVVFAAYARGRGIPLSALPAMAWRGVSKIGNILAIFVLIGILTGLWRLSGTIAQLVDFALPLVDPRFFALWCFLLCGAMSTLIGTSFGTVSTLGVICLLMARAGGFDVALAAGAIVSGIYVGDRCSPMSSSASLVALVTGTRLYDNIRSMLRSGLVPLALACAVYAVLSWRDSGQTADSAVTFGAHFAYNFWVVLPAVLVVAMALLRIDVKAVMAASAVAAGAAAIAFQGADLAACARVAVFGLHPEEPDLAMLSGGGIVSMAEVGGIVAISSSYGEMLERSRLLDCVERLAGRVRGAIGAFRTTALVGVLSVALSCNQTLATIITAQLCGKVQPDRRELAMYIENSVIVVSAAIPWSIAFSMPAGILGVGMEAIPFAVYVWGLPLFWALMPARRRQA